jgi:acyl-CoA thioesterase I
MFVKINVSQFRCTRRHVLAGTLSLGLAFSAAAAQAAAISILALGASNTTGYGVATSAAWPAQLESMLRAKGYDVTVSVNAVNGATSADILSRTSVPPGTSVVVYETGLPNDRRHNIPPAQSQANLAQIVARIRAAGAVPLMSGKGQLSTNEMQADGEHANATGHALIAARLVPQVIAIIRKKH